MDSLIVQAKVKRFALQLGKDRFKTLPSYQPIAVSQQFVDDCDAYLRAYIRGRVAINKGKIIK